MSCPPGSGSLDESCQPLGNRPPDINWLLHVYNENDMSIIYISNKVMFQTLVASSLSWRMTVTGLPFVSSLHVTLNDIVSIVDILGNIFY